jgi:hypothetical protein
VLKAKRNFFLFPASVRGRIFGLGMGLLVRLGKRRIGREPLIMEAGKAPFFFEYGHCPTGEMFLSFSLICSLSVGEPPRE